MPFKKFTITIPKEKKIEGLALWVNTQHTDTINSLAAKDQYHSLLSTTNRNQDILNCIIDMIHRAKKIVFLATFILENKEVEDALIDAVKRLNGNVYILTVLDTTVFKNISAMENEDVNYEQAHERFKKMAENGIYIRQHPNCHAKFLVIDNNEALITSANIRDTSLKKNIEIGVRIIDKESVTSLSTLFQYLWVHQTDRQYTPIKDGSTLGSIPWKYPKKEVPPPIGKITWTENQNHFLMKTLVKLIDSAERRILISTYNFRELEREEVRILYDALVKALERKVEIEILTHITPGQKGQSTNESVLFSNLIQFGGNLKLYGHPTLHAKYIIIDDKSTIVFTGNLDGRHGLTNGIDIGILINNEKLSQKISAWHLQIRASCPMRNLFEPTPLELKDGNATYLVDKEEYLIEASKEKADEIISKLESLDGDNVPLYYRAAEQYEKSSTSINENEIQKNLDKNGFHIMKIGHSLVPNSQQQFEIIKETIVRPRNFGYLFPKCTNIIVHWSLSLEDVDQWLQTYIFSRNPNDNGLICNINEIMTDYAKAHEAIDLPFTNSIDKWKEHLELIFGKNVWSDYDFQDEQIFITATDEEIRKVLETINPTLEERASKKGGIRKYEVITQEVIEERFRILNKRLPKRVKDWTKISRFLPDKNWNRTENRYERRKR